MYDVDRYEQRSVKVVSQQISTLFDLAWINQNQAIGLGPTGKLFELTFTAEGYQASVRQLHDGGQELGSRHTYCILPQTEDIYWISTTDGIARFDRKTMRYTLGGTDQGVLWSDFNFMACSKTSKKVFWFAGLDGWTQIDPTNTQSLEKAEQPSVRFWHVGPNGIPIAPTNHALTQEESTGLLRVAIAARGNPMRRPKVAYYKLDGFDPAWRTVDPRTTIEYAGLSAGQYTLKASFSGPDHQFADATSLHVEIRPPWYRSGPARLFWLVLFMTAVALVLRRRHQRVLVQKAHLHQVETSERRLSLALHASASVLWDECEGTTLRTSADWLGFSAEELSGSTSAFEQLMHPEDLDAYRQAMAACRSGVHDSMHIEYRLRHRKGHWVWVLDTGRVTPVDGANSTHIRLTGTFHEITRVKAVEDDLRRMVAEDALTGLPNRRECDRLLDAAIQRCAQTRTELAVIFFDLDQFKHINDSMGHGFGDAILQRVADTLLAMLPPGAQVCRQGGDEFVALMPCQDLAQAMDTAQSVRRAIKSITRVAQVEVALSTSVGVAMYPHHSTDRHTLLRYADAAMYMAKDNGRNQVCMFDPRSAPIILERPHIEAALSQAVERGEFELVYQPKIRLVDERCIGFEALLRWRNPSFAHVPLSSVIQILESSGLIREVGTWVLEQACEDLALLRLNHVVDVHMAVNVSPRQLDRGDFLDQVSACLRQHHIPASVLELELTESMFVGTQGDRLEQIAALRSTGVSIAIDDFGTGYSSLSYLRTLPADVVKIDKSFIDHIDTDFRTEQVCEAITHLANNLNLRVVAEGVERASQVTLLKRMSCDIVQGYHYSRPLPVDQLAQWLTAQSGSHPIKQPLKLPQGEHPAQPQPTQLPT
jgi:diguanylate cyclase (GGDEF)-like protein/PAS domain S-box-containing protein